MNQYQSKILRASQWLRFILHIPLIKNKNVIHCFSHLEERGGRYFDTLLDCWFDLSENGLSIFENVIIRIKLKLHIIDADELSLEK